jgi:16S rRNA (uracil1498-N3)-methyltransferase
VRLLYVPNLIEGCIELPEDEARHAVKALRAREGDTFRLIDGRGGAADGVIVEVGKRSCVVEVLTVERAVRPQPTLTMIVSPTKQTDRFEWFLEKAVEIGVDRVIPVFTSRSERKVEKHERWEKVLVSAMKQSQRTWLPELSRACPLEEALESLDDSSLLVAHCMSSVDGGEKKHLLHALQKGKRACIAIGPEGDFNEEEVALMLSKGGVEISLGESRLRTETAAIAAVAYFRALQA